MMIRRRPRGRPAFTLLEMSAVMWALAIVLVVGVFTLLGAVRLERSAGVAFQHQARRDALADQFRVDVAAATATPASLGEIDAGPACLILRLADGRHVVYRGEGGHLERAEIADLEDNLLWVSLGNDLAGVNFSRPAPDGKVVALTLDETQGASGPKRSRTFAAALGGDVR